MMSLLDSVVKRYEDLLKDESIVGSSYTLHAMDMLIPVLEYLRGKGIKVFMDLGCGYGLLTFIVADFIGVEKVYVVDIDVDKLSLLNNKIRSRSSVKEVILLNHDFCKPVDINEKVQLVTSFGSLEHVTCWDDVLEDVNNVLVNGGYFLVSMPNLGSWVNRLALLLGYQPRDLEISTKKLYGVAPPYGHEVIGHVKVATFKAFKEYLMDNGFEIVIAKPLYNKQSLLINLIDKIFSTPALSRRFIVLARKIR
ncbi:MAG: class I SAM-dependent methyltransferase [Acidilobaceae archaeon]